MPKVVVSPADEVYKRARQTVQRYPGAVEMIDLAVANAQSAFPRAGIELLVCISRLNEIAQASVVHEDFGERVNVPEDCRAPFLIWIRAANTEDNQRLLELACENVDSTVVYMELRPSNYQQVMQRWMA